MIRKKRNSATLEEFMEEAVPIKQVVWGKPTSSPLPGTAQESVTAGPAVLLDLSNHPDISITDLSRLFRTDVPGGEDDMEFGWDYWIEPDNERVRLILAYSRPVRLEFSLVFFCNDSTHWDVLRWILENDGMLVLSDEEAGPVTSESSHTPRSTLLVHMGELENPTDTLRLIKIRQAEAKKGKPLTGVELARKALEVRRALSIENLSEFLVGLLNMPIQGNESILLYTWDTHKRVPISRISEQFKQVLYQLSRQSNIQVAYVKGAPYLIQIEDNHG